MAGYQTYMHEKANRDLSMIPGSYGLPLIGQTFNFIDDNVKTMLGNYRKYGPVFRLSLAFQNIVSTVGPDFIRQVTLDQDKVFSSRAGWKGMVGEFFQGSLIVQDFDDHRLQRRLMQTAFKAESLHGYIDSMNSVVGSTERLAGTTTHAVLSGCENITARHRGEGIPGDSIGSRRCPHQQRVY